MLMARGRVVVGLPSGLAGSTAASFAAAGARVGAASSRPRARQVGGLGSFLFRLIEEAPRRRRQARLLGRCAPLLGFLPGARQHFGLLGLPARLGPPGFGLGVGLWGPWARWRAARGRRLTLGLDQLSGLRFGGPIGGIRLGRLGDRLGQGMGCLLAQRRRGQGRHGQDGDARTTSPLQHDPALPHPAVHGPASRRPVTSARWASERPAPGEARREALAPQGNVSRICGGKRELG